MTKSVSMALVFLLCAGCGMPAASKSAAAGESAQSAAERIDQLLKLARDSWRTDPGQSVAYAGKARDIARDHNLSAEESDSLYYAGVGYYYQGEFALSLERFRDALEIAKRDQHALHKSKAFNGLGMVYKNLGDFDRALEFYLKSLRTLRGMQDKARLGSVTNNIGGIYLNLKDYDTAIRYYHEARELFRASNHLVGVSTADNNLGDVYTELEQYHRALSHYRRSLDIREDPWGRAVAMKNIGDIHFRLGDLDRAARFYRQSYEIMRKIPNRNRVALSLYSLARVDIQRQRYADAHEKLQKSLEIAEDEGILNLRKKILAGLSDLEAARGNSGKALEYYRRYTAVNEQLFDAQLKDRVAELQVLYQVEDKERQILLLKKEREIQRLQVQKQRNLKNFLLIVSLLALLVLLAIARSFILKKRTNRQLETVNRRLSDANRRLSQSEDRLKQINDSKDKFFSIIAHDLKNSLGGFKGLSEIMVKQFDDLDSDEKRNYLELLHRSAGDLFALLENLLVWSRAQTGRIVFNPRDYDLHDIAQSAIAHVRPMADGKGITIENSLAANTVVTCDREMIIMVLRNLLANGIKFTPAGGRVTVSGKETRSGWTVTVTDTGIGIPEEDLKKLFRIDVQHSTPGTDDESGTGLGLILCKEFIQRHGGSIRVESRLHKGTEVVFTLPESAKSSSLSA